MSWRLAGQYVANCSCAMVCPCPMDGKPTGPKGECKGAAVFHVAKGNLDGTDLSGVTFAFYNHFPTNLSAGNWEAGIVVDDRASDEQMKALERICTGQEGGPFAEFAPLIREFKGTERASVKFIAGKKPSGTVGRYSTLGFEPVLAPDGTPTTIKNAPYGFAPEYQIGAGSGSSKGIFGLEFDHVYGETADYEYSSEVEPATAKGRM